MKTRLVVSAVTLAALALGSVSSFAQGITYDPTERPYDSAPSYRALGQQQRAWQRAHDGGQYVQRVPAPAPAPAPDWRARRDWREQQRREEHRHRGYTYAQPGYAYAQPRYYEQPAYVYQQQPYYGEYDNSSDAGNIVLGAILGGVIANAVVNSR